MTKRQLTCSFSPPETELLQRKNQKLSFSFSPPKKDFFFELVEKTDLRLVPTEVVYQILLSFTERMQNKVGISRFLYEVAFEKSLTLSAFFLETSKKDNRAERKKHELPIEVQETLRNSGYYIFSQIEEVFLQKLRSQVINSDTRWWLYNGHFLQVLGIRHPSGMMAQLFLPNVWWGERPLQSNSEETKDYKFKEISVASEWNEIEDVASILFSIDMDKFKLMYAAHKHNFHETVTCRNLIWQIPSNWPLGSLPLDTFPFSIGKIGRMVDLIEKTSEIDKAELVLIGSGNDS